MFGASSHRPLLVTGPAHLVIGPFEGRTRWRNGMMVLGRGAAACVHAFALLVAGLQTLHATPQVGWLSVLLVTDSRMQIRSLASLASDTTSACFLHLLPLNILALAAGSGRG